MIFGPACCGNVSDVGESYPEACATQATCCQSFGVRDGDLFDMGDRLEDCVDLLSAGKHLIVLPWIGRTFRKRAVLTIVVTAMILSCYCVLFLGMGGGALKEMGQEKVSHR